jgi:hypothetical protein
MKDNFMPLSMRSQRPTKILFGYEDEVLARQIALPENDIRRKTRRGNIFRELGRFDWR